MKSGNDSPFPTTGRPAHISAGPERRRARDVCYAALVYAVKSLTRSPRFAIVAAGTLAAAVGFGLVLLAIASAVIFRALPIVGAESLVVVRSAAAPSFAAQSGISVADWDEIVARTGVFEKAALIRTLDVLLERDGGMDRVIAGEFSSALLPLLETRLIIGQPFDERAGSRSVILSYSYWQREFGGNPTALGKTIRLDGTRTAVISGVLPDNFPLYRLLFRSDPQLFVPIDDPDRPRDNRMWTGIGRLRHGITIPEARFRLHQVSQALRKEFPTANRSVVFDATPLPVAVQGVWRSAILFLLGAVALLIAAACANVAALFVARTLLRRSEFGLRLALGATWVELAMILLFEGVLIACAGTVIGILCASVVVRTFTATELVRRGIPRIESAGIDATVIAGAIAGTVLIAIAVSVVAIRQVRGSRLSGVIAHASDASEAAVRSRTLLMTTR